MNCHHCGSCIAEETAFCPHCGTRLQTEAPKETAAAEQPAAKIEEPGKGLAIAGIICGITSIMYLHLVLGAIGLIFGLVARHKGYKKGISTASIACGSVGLGIGLLVLLLGIVAGLLVANTVPYAWDYFEEMTSLIITELI